MNTREKVLIHKGIDKVRRMEYEQALEIFDRVLEDNPAISEAWNNKGVALFRMERAEEAIDCYNRSLAIDPENLDALRNKGFAQRSLGKLDESLLTYNSVLQKGGDALDLESMAAVLASLGRPEEALECMFQAIKMEPRPRFEEEIEVLKGMIQQKDSDDSQGQG